MSAHTERLLEQIRLLEQRLAEPGLDTPTQVACSNELRNLRRQLSSATEALTEGKQILKG